MEYELDRDMVYQRQWLSFRVSATTIQDYLVGTVISVCIYLRLAQGGLYREVGLS